MSNALTIQQPAALATANQWSREKLDLLKRTVAAGTSDDEFELFCEVAQGSGLNPFQRQIYAIMRQESFKDERGNWQKRQKMTIQTGIDGYRVIAARTGQHAGTTDPEYGPKNAEGYPEWARVVVKKLMPGGVVAEFPATARWSEYAQTNKEGVPTGQWPKMPFLMLGKCAEALALRKAFPAELSGVYTAEEMNQADSYTAGPTINTDTGEVTNPPAVTPQGPKPNGVLKTDETAELRRRLAELIKSEGVEVNSLKAWCKHQGYPEESAKMNAEQLTHLITFLTPQKEEA